MRAGLILSVVILGSACVSPDGPPVSSKQGDPPSSIGVGTLLTPAPAPVGWSYRTWVDPAFKLALPPGWEDSPIQTIDPAVVASWPPEVQRATNWLGRLIAAGSVRLIAGGPTTPGSPDDGSVVVIVENGDGFAKRVRGPFDP